ncbi:MAG: redox-sensing transcriptional repressor Rex [Lachnospiraceae bacterium]|nr:redox-sensing transcriptional repressor Rex [Lachnospiraceae bacterium]
MTEKKISSAVIKRLPRYYRYLSELLENGIDRISSQELSRKMNVTASQIRQDFNNFGGFGQQGYGYNVEVLREEIGKILGLDQKYHVIILGAGNLGQALANYGGFTKRGFIVSGIFDVNPEKVGQKIGDTQVMDMAKLQEFVAKNTVDIAALTLPKAKAPEVAKELVGLGVCAFWNFAATDLNLPEGVAVENVHLAESLMRLSYNIVNLNKD